MFILSAVIRGINVSELLQYTNQRHQNGLMKEQDVVEVKKMYKYGDCSFCGGEVKYSKVELDYRHKGDLYIFQNVPVGVCRQCGEKYLTAKIAKEIEHKIKTKEKWDKTITVPVDVFPEEIAV